MSRADVTVAYALALLLALTVGGIATGLARAADPSHPLYYTHAFGLDLGLFGGVRMTVETRSEAACSTARRAVSKKLLQEASGVVAYALGDCAAKP